MGKQRLSVHRKNELRKKYGFFRVRIPLLESISVLKVTIPLELLSFKISLPLTAFSGSQASSLTILQSRLNLSGIIPQGIVN